MPGYEWLKKDFESERTKLNIEKVKQLVPIAKDLGCSLAQLGLAWCAKNPNVSTVITGASKPQQVKQNMKAIDKLDILTPEVMGKINKILDNVPTQNPDLR